MTGSVHRGLSPAQLVETAILRGEGQLTASGALQVTTGKYTGRSPHDKFIVDSPAVHEKIAWGENKPFSPEKFDQLYHRMQAYMQKREIFVFDGFAGADPENRIHVRFTNEFAWQNLFVHQLFIGSEIDQSDMTPDFNVICLPDFKAAPTVDGTASEAFIVLNFDKRLVLIGGTHYAGEMKKSIFTVMNYILPERNVLSMHCSANVGMKGDAALFFGLSGTGKTTLSADPDRQLIGDDEHGWSERGIFNIEGGCYAKCIGLKRETEPQIWEAIRFGAVLENVAIDKATRQPDFDDGSFTENTRVAYPVEYIPNALIPGVAGHPQTIIFLTADAFGVLPPIAKLNAEQAMYHFLSGYTSKLAGTERGITEPQATFSACFGAPFLPLSANMYAKLLGEKLTRHQTSVFLINTGWSGGPYGIGKRMKLAYTRAMVTAAIEGLLKDVSYQLDPIFNIYIPESCPGVPGEVLIPRNTWIDKSAYEQKARELARLFAQNFSKFKHNVSSEIIAAGPKS
ncbi:phosphoenolpyruvate carboxykinase (ATP) [Sporomusa acidovorans]|uniref:Phosphoenolpyruvate carboxykinase (ATP) n=1 Tax=Sporomusa acidovorans (strain ATCC 49682 / DSM 3132 / Mol) TaxID=1123286 RepID=A0ABZ3J5Q3_SPOA4|nr:phosphoenolpyruvate carboxykinase (ATP) [Sporomusa acidovorans]OZC16408.1 phosphoenolpyruvate carboxykinase [Sporomusa acidovorans DSM 3132]SDE99545.1 phosphoenolpyruvate carboxykinase (ATP) [Sporomusa acidovorans]